MSYRILSAAALCAVLFTLVFGGAASAWDNIYDCCGNPQGGLYTECRFTDRDKECNDTSGNCLSEGYTTCCLRGCVRGMN